MWYLGALFCTVVELILVAAIGSGIARLLPWRLRPEADLFISPLLGLAALVLAATLLGWVGRGYHFWTCAGITALFVVGGSWLHVGRRRTAGEYWRALFPGELPKRLLALTAFGALASYPVLCPLWHVNGYTPYNDTFTYLCHAQWLQTHGFGQRAEISPFHPMTTQIASYQDSSLRMGASFFLGWLQAFFNQRWSYEIFPTAAALALACGALAVGGLVLAVCPGRRLEAWLVALVAAVTVNGFGFGATHGFLPQTYGLAFAAGAFALRGMQLASGQPDAPLGGWRDWRAWGKPLRADLPLALLLAAAEICYTEQTPFLALAIGASYLAPPWPRGRMGWIARAAAAARVSVLAALLVNLEWLRAWRALHIQAGAVVGMPVAWSWWMFPAHALGLKSGLWDGSARWLDQVRPGGALLGFALVGGFLALATSAGRQRWRAKAGSRARWNALVPAGGLLGFFTAAFVIFRYHTASPWPDGFDSWPPGVGQSWNQFKLSNWASLAMIGIAGTLVTALGGHASGPKRWAAAIFLMLWAGAGLQWNCLRAPSRAADILRPLQRTSDPFSEYLGFRQALAEVPRADVIYLDMLPAWHKHREMLSYFLYDYRLMSDWNDDGFLADYFAPFNPLPSASQCDWIAHHTPPETFPKALPRPPAMLTIEPTGRNAFTLDKVKGPYDRENRRRERQIESWYYWTSERLNMNFTLRARVPRQVRLRFYFRPATAGRTLDVHISSEAGERTISIPMEKGEHNYVTDPLDFRGAHLDVIFSTAQFPETVGAPKDMRPLSFYVGNVRVEGVE